MNTPMLDGIRKEALFDSKQALTSLFQKIPNSTLSSNSADFSRIMNIIKRRPSLAKSYGEVLGKKYNLGFRILQKDNTSSFLPYKVMSKMKRLPSGARIPSEVQKALPISKIKKILNEPNFASVMDGRSSETNEYLDLLRRGSRGDAVNAAQNIRKLFPYGGPFIEGQWMGEARHLI